MEYYSKLNMEVEKSKMHTEWKIKRLQLDQSRMQLLSTEERNLKREKLELEHQKNEEVMAMSIQSDIIKSDDELDNKEEKVVEGSASKEIESASSNVMKHLEVSGNNSEHGNNKVKSQTSTAVFSAICNAAKSFFGVSKSHDDDRCDNNKDLDAQGNIVQKETEINSYTLASQSSSEIGSKLDDAYDNLQYQKTKQEALMNKQKVLSHEFGKTDKENNQVKDPPLIQVATMDEENNLQDWSPFVEAKRNKLKVLGAEFDIVNPLIKPITSEPRTEAQKEALINKQKVLGVEYNLPAETVVRKEPANEAQEAAVRNKNKILNSDYDMMNPASPRNSKRSGLTLNLKPYGESTGATYRLGVTPNNGSVTPGDFFPRVSVSITCFVSNNINLYMNIFTVLARSRNTNNCRRTS